MEPLAQFGLQFVLSFVFFAVVAAWYISPALSRRKLEAALVPLFLVQTTRFIPLSGLAPGQVGPDVSLDAIAQIGYNGLATSILALVAALFLRYGWPAAVPLAWLINAVTFAEGCYASYLALTHQFVMYPLVVNWFIISYWLPVIFVIHFLIFIRLYRG